MGENPGNNTQWLIPYRPILEHLMPESVVCRGEEYLFGDRASAEVCPISPCRIKGLPPLQKGTVHLRISKINPFFLLYVHYQASFFNERIFMIFGAPGETVMARRFRAPVIAFGRYSSTYCDCE